jgi:hypothetical protein
VAHGNRAHDGGGSRACDVWEEGRLWWSQELPLGDGEVVLGGVCSGLILLPHEGSLVLALMGDDEGRDKGGVGYVHIIWSNGEGDRVG